MKNIIYKHLKTCVLSLCVAVSCGDKAFGEPGVYFLCNSCSNEKCRMWVKETDWIKHNQKEHNYTGEPGAELEVPGMFLCGQCKDEGKAQEGKFLHPCDLRDHMYETHEKDKKYDIACVNCPKALPWDYQDMHIIFHQNYGERCGIENCTPGIVFHCKVCEECIGYDDWNQHVHEEHRSDFSKNMFVCLNCEEFRHQKKGKEICCQECGYENCVQCRICAKEIEEKTHLNEKKDETIGKDSWSEGMDGLFEKGNWNNHVDNTHGGDYCGKFWYCPGCKKLRYQERKGIVWCQKCKYMYCPSHKGVFEKEKWNDHLIEEHKKDKDSFLLYPSSISE